MNNYPTPPNDALSLAQRLHCLTCMLSEAVDSGDQNALQALFDERDRVIGLLGQSEITPEAHEWIDKTTELEAATLADWRSTKTLIESDMLINGRVKSNLAEYGHQLKSA